MMILMFGWNIKSKREAEKMDGEVSHATSDYNG